MDVLQKDEGVRLDRMFAHGGLFKTKGVAQRFLAAAIDTPVSVGDVAAEGGAWGIAVLAAYTVRRSSEQALADYLDNTVFADVTLETLEPRPARRRRLRRLHPALHRRPGGRAGCRRPHLIGPCWSPINRLPRTRPGRP